MSLDQRFLTGYRMTEEEPPEPGLYLNDDGSVSVVDAGGVVAPLGAAPFYNLQVATGASVDINWQWVSFVMAGRPEKTGGLRASPVSVPFHVGASGLVAVPGEFSVNALQVPDDGDVVDLSATFVATNTAGTQVLVLTVSNDGPLVDGRLAIVWSGAAVSRPAGTDLTWDGSTVASTAGGVFVVGALFTAGWD